MPSITKLQPSLDKPYLSLAINIVMKPSCVSPCGNKHDHIRMSTFLIALLDPFRQFSAIRRIAENHLPPPNFELIHHPRWYSVFRTWCSHACCMGLSALSWSNNHCGVGHSVVLLVNKPLVIIHYSNNDSCELTCSLPKIKSQMKFLA